MRLSKGNDNNFKRGRFWLYLSKSHDKSIGLEYVFKPLHILNFNISFEGEERRWILNFWFLFEFWLTFNSIFKWYPKEWNSCGEGGYLHTAERKIGISQWGSTVYFYFWHDGENSWYPDKDNKLWYKSINFYDILTGGHSYKTLDDKAYVEYINLPEKTYEIQLSCRSWHKTYKRFYCKPFQTKGKSVRIEENDIKYPSRKYTDEDKEHGTSSEELEKNVDSQFYLIKIDDDISVVLKKYRDLIIEYRSVESPNWVPFEYRTYVQREEKLKRILNVR